MDIVEADNSVPVRMKPYKTSPTDRRKIAEILQEWKQAGKTTNAAAVVRVLDKFCSERGIPDRIITDRGTCFTANAFGKFCSDREIRHTLNSTRHPQANGQVERANRTIVSLLSVTATEHNNWDTQLRYVENMLNTAPNKSTTKTPYETLHGYLPRFHKGILPTLSLTRNNWRDPQEIQTEARRNIIDAHRAMKISHDRKRDEGEDDSDEGKDDSDEDVNGTANPPKNDEIHAGNNREGRADGRMEGP
ncbi:unnamed protein product [Macrosiphum euphorbiae]|uniref:Integrase catalytic domain-containing protein n=1 Tax=Macrosiphum euphorbiae TaxID=13131 RepID=A0AAV0XJP7_9HEMI|nr:unnamed protein product [Macrosiphum euphorbiae]